MNILILILAIWFYHLCMDYIYILTFSIFKVINAIVKD